MRSKTKLLMAMARALRSYLARSETCGHLPIRAWVDVSGVCNLRCVMCPNSVTSEGPRTLMAYGLFVSIIDQLKSHVYDVNLFLSGEPLLHPDLARMIVYAREAGVKTVLNTNATRLTPALADGILASGLDRIVFSFDSPDRERYESTRVGARFDETLENIRSFLELKKRRRVRRPWTVLQMIEFDEDRQARKRYRRLFQNLPIDEFKFIRPHTFGGVFAEYQSIRGKQYAPCTFLWYAINILADGSVVPCCLDFGGKHRMGKVGEQTVAGIWNGERYREMRTKIAAKRHGEIELCRECDILWKNRVFGIPTRYLWNFIRENLFQ